MEKGMITARQFGILVAFCVIGDSLLIMPGFLSSIARHDAWLSAAFGLVLGVPVVLIFCLAANCYPKLNLIESLHKVYGNWIGALLSLLFLFHSLLNSGAILREAGDFITTHSLPQTPIAAVMLLFSVIIAMAIKLRLEAFTRTAELLIVVFILFFLFFCAALLPQVKPVELQPVLSNGFLPVMRGSLVSFTFSFVEVSALLMITPYVSWKGKGSMRKQLVLGALLGGLVMLIVTLLTITVLGAHLTERQMYPTYTLAKKISIGGFIERLEAMLALMWIITNYFKIVVHAYALSAGLSYLLRLKDYRELAVPVTLLVTVTAMIVSPNIVFFNTELTKNWPMFDIFFSLGIPVLLIIGYAFRKGAGFIGKL